MSDQDPGPTHTPYGQPSGQPDPYGQSNPYGQPPAGGLPYGQQPYGQQPVRPAPYGQPTSDRRPGTVTAAAWITIVFSAIVAAVFGFTTLALIVARDQVITEMERVPEFQDANIDADAAVGVLVAVMLGLVVWSVIAIVLAVLVLRRSNVARILLVISSSVTALLSLLSITSGITIVTLIAAVATIVMLFAGGASAWFKRMPAHGGYGGYPGDPYGTPPAGPYGQPVRPAPSGQPDPYGQSAPQQPSPYGNPYGSQPGQDSAPQYPPPSENPYGQPPPGRRGWVRPPAEGLPGPLTGGQRARSAAARRRTPSSMISGCLQKAQRTSWRPASASS